MCVIRLYKQWKVRYNKFNGGELYTHPWLGGGMPLITGMSSFGFSKKHMAVVSTTNRPRRMILLVWSAKQQQPVDCFLYGTPSNRGDVFLSARTDYESMVKD